jgi:hypothetical protein
LEAAIWTAISTAAFALCAVFDELRRLVGVLVGVSFETTVAMIVSFLLDHRPGQPEQLDRRFAEMKQKALDSRPIHMQEWRLDDLLAGGERHV